MPISGEHALVQYDFLAAQRAISGIAIQTPVLSAPRLVRDCVDEHVVVEEAEIRQAMAFAARELKLVVEGGGAVGIAALLAGRIDHPGENVAVVVSGGNVDLGVLIELVDETRQNNS